MQKRTYILLFFSLVLLAFNAQAQYGNEWIVPGQTYYKISTAQSGMYAFSRSQLQAAGINIGAIDPRSIQVWHRGIQQSILIKGEADGSFDTSDSLIFYGKINDGTLDVNLYLNPTYQPHSYYNLYNDTTAYFLTWVPASTSNKRMLPSSAVSAPIANYHMGEYLNVYKSDYSRGIEYGEAKQSYGDRGETWCGDMQYGAYTENISLPNVNTSSGANCRVEVMIVGRNNTFNRRTALRIGNLSSGTIIDSFNLFSQQDRSYASHTFPASLLGSSISITVDPSATPGNYYSMAYIKITYPQDVTMGGAATKIFQPGIPAQASVFSINWTSSVAPVAYDYTDKDNLKVLSTTMVGSTLQVFVPSAVIPFVVMQSNAYLTVPTNQIKQVDLSPYGTTQDFIILTHRKLWTESQEYADYRSSPAGGGHSVLLADVDKIYNQFGYGEYSPVGIKRFFSYQTAVNPNAKSVFLIGKGVDLMFKANLPQFYRQNPVPFITNSDPNLRIENFIPPAGSPASDVLYVMNTSNRPSMAIGRLSAKTGTDIISYLNKVMEHEALDSSYIWRKRLVHLSGGADVVQIDTFRGYVDGFKYIAENSIFGGKVVKTYSKKPGSEAIDQVDIADDVNEGLGFITFFGHSSFSVTELDIGYVSQPIFGYHNKGKYPMLIVNGCQSANSYNNYSLGEDWLNTAEKGAIAVLGVSDIGYTSPLRDYSDAMYRAMFDTDSLKAKPAGVAMKHMLNVKSFDTQTTHQMNFHGDPMVKIYNPSKPDYEISGDRETRKDVPNLKSFLKSYDGKTITASTDSFRIGIPVKNFGIYDNDKYFVSVVRSVGGKQINYKNIEYNPVRYVDTLYFPIKGNNNPSNYGLNVFEIKIDVLDTIHEMDEYNNTATIEYFMGLSGVTCLFPKEFSIVHDQPITFVAQATNLLVQQRPYHFQLDTSYKFNSSFRKDTVVSSGSLAKWPKVFLKTNNNTDSTVYYWRVRYNDLAGSEDTSWATSSFIYIKDSPDGWSQSEAPQFMKDGVANLQMDLADSTWKFTGASIDLLLTVYGNGSGNPFDSTLFKVGEVSTMFPGYGWVNCGPGGPTENETYEFNGIVAIALDKNTVENYSVPGYGLCGRYPKPIVQPFGTNGGNVTSFVNWLNAVNPGDYIIIGSNGNANFSNANWASAKALLASAYGAQKTNDLDDNEPYALLAKKGATTPIMEKHSNNTFTSVTIDTTIYGRYNNGSILSTRIGPSTKWGTFYQKIDSTGSDRYRFRVLGERLDGTIDTLNINLPFAKNVQAVDTVDLGPLIDPTTYPYIKLLCQVYDSSAALDPPQLKKWQVIYHKSPEGTMNPFVAGLDNYNVTTKDEGASVCIPYVFENIADLDFQDSLYVRITAQGEGSMKKDTLFIVYKDTLHPGQSFKFTYCLNTKGLSGKITLRTFVNPNLQPEEYYANNVIETTFDVIKDKIAPVIDVTFDGVHIMDGDIVSPSPVITITLNDNSKYLLITDPNDISIFFKRPGSTEEQILPVNSDVLRFGQSPGSSNTFTIEYNPKNLPDGDYTIIVQGKDVNGNKSGQYYKVTFRVENASTISNFYPYPNPFSSSTRFVFTLTGHYIPDDLKIQIMTVTGKVVREITKEELGHLHIGNNKTEYAWNGTDEFGDKLANGVYLYRVIIKNRGDNFEHRDTAGDKAFKKDFGKLYILR